MKVTKQYCDVCGKECTITYMVDVEEPKPWIYRTGIGRTATRDDPPRAFGKNTFDGVWEIELCSDCVDKAISKLLEMKPEDKE